MNNEFYDRERNGCGCFVPCLVFIALLIYVIIKSK